MATTPVNLIGKRFERLYVIDQKKNKGYRTVCKCICDCGNITYVSTSDLTFGKTRSCGCLRAELNRLPKKHGMSYTRIYRIYREMLKRCYTPSSIEYKNYGGRGIKLCDEWLHSFENFHKWAMENGYTDELTIDRIDVNGNYEPSNCRWATRKQQMNNKTVSHYLIYKGEKHTISEWSEIAGIEYGTLISRINKLRWSVEDALTKPVKKGNYNKREG